MKILLIDALSMMLDYALRCEAAGHEVRVFIPKNNDGSRSKIGDGLITKVPEWEAHMNWADFIMVSDNCKYIHALESYRNRGYPLCAPNIECTSWELERNCGQRVLEASGIQIIPSECFTSYEKAREYVRSSMKRYVSKPDGDVDKALSYVSKGPADMIFMLDYWQKRGKKKPAFLLQEFIPGIEMAVGGWFGRGGFSKYFLENFEFKKLMNGEIGCNTGEQGTVMKYVTAEQSLLARELLLPLTGELYRQGYTGYIDVAAIIDTKGNPQPLEFTCRLGWPLFNIQQILHPDPVGWLYSLCCDGVDTFEPCLETALGVVVTIPPFPYSFGPTDMAHDFPVWGVTDKNRYFIHPAFMKLGEAPEEKDGKIVNKPMLVTAGDYVLIASGFGGTVCEAKDCAYSVVEELEISNSPMFRTDIGCRLEEQLPELQALGYAEEWKYD